MQVGEDGVLTVRGSISGKGTYRNMLREPMPEQSVNGLANRQPEGWRVDAWEHPMWANVPRPISFAEKVGQLRPQLVEAVGLRTSFKWL